MATLTGNSVASTYKQLLKITSESLDADASAKYVEDGEGTDSALSLSTTRVGIGTASPGAKLEVYDSGSNVIVAHLKAATNPKLHLTDDTSGHTSSDGFTFSQGGADVYMWNHENGFMGYATDGTEQMRLSATGGLSLGSGYIATDPGAGSMIIEGNVGIGTTIPGSELEVNGDIGIARTAGGYTFREVVGGAERAGIKSNVSNELIFNVAGVVEAMRIDGSGRVGIGDSSPSYQLELSTNSAAKPTSTLWTVPSDERLKDNIELADLDVCYDIVQNLPLKRFKWKEDVYTDEQTDDRSVLGWIAQDVKSVFPKSVKESNFRGVSNNDGVSAVEAQDEVEWTDKPTEENTKDEIKAWMDSNSLSYNSGDTKQDLLDKIPELKQEAIEAVEGVEETFKLEIENCMSVDADQIFRAMFGAIQKLQAKVEALENQ